MGQFNIIDYQTGWKVDLILRKNRPFSAGELKRRSTELLDGLSVFMVSPEDSLLSKLEWAKAGSSERQLVDAAGIIQSQGAGLDLEYLKYWSQKLGVEEQLDQSRRIAEQSTQ